MIDRSKARVWKKSEYKMHCANPECDASVYLICTTAATDDSVFPSEQHSWLFGGLELADESGPVHATYGQVRCASCHTLNVFAFED